MKSLRCEIKSKLAAADLSLIAVTRSAGLSYQRCQRVLAGYINARPGELDEIKAAVEKACGL